MRKTGNKLLGIGTDPWETAKAAGLKYEVDGGPGINRERTPDGFRYVLDGREVRDTETRIRIKSLGLPPAWERVWISPRSNAHIQAVGYDKRGRKQYRYHPEWVKLRGLVKFERMSVFGQKLPLIRKKVKNHLQLPGMPREKVLAIIVNLLDKTFLRIGNAEYEKDNKTYGLTTLKNDHVKVRKDEINFKFRAKSGKEHAISLHDPLLAKLVKRCKELPGFHLFTYIDANGIPRDVCSRDVNQYLKELSGQEFTAKDFRTWGGTMTALSELKAFVEGEATSQSGVKRLLNTCVKKVAERLNNTVAVCRKYYIHPKVFDWFSDGRLAKYVEKQKRAIRHFSEKHLIEILSTA